MGIVAHRPGPGRVAYPLLIRGVRQALRSRRLEGARGVQGKERPRPLNIRMPPKIRPPKQKPRESTAAQRTSTSSARSNHPLICSNFQVTVRPHKKPIKRAVSNQLGSTTILKSTSSHFALKKSSAEASAMIANMIAAPELDKKTLILWFPGNRVANVTARIDPVAEMARRLQGGGSSLTGRSTKRERTA